MDYQIITDTTGKVLAVLSYCTVALAREVARQYARILGERCYRRMLRLSNPDSVPQVGSTISSHRQGEETRP